MDQEHGLGSDSDIIRLDQFLKLQGMADTGGQAKVAIRAGEVRVNGEVETRRGRQLHIGDVVEFQGRKLPVESDEAEPDEGSPRI